MIPHKTISSLQTSRSVRFLTLYNVFWHYLGIWKTWILFPYFEKSYQSCEIFFLLHSISQTLQQQPHFSEVYISSISPRKMVKFCVADNESKTCTSEPIHYWINLKEGQIQWTVLFNSMSTLYAYDSSQFPLLNPFKKSTLWWNDYG